MMKNRFKFRLIMIAILTVTVASIAVGDLYYKKNMALEELRLIEHKRAINNDYYLSQLLQDLGNIQSINHIKITTQSNDAGPYLNGRLSGRDFLNLSMQTRHLLNKYGSNWKEAALILKEKPKFEWMKKLLEFDYWELTSNELDLSSVFEVPNAEILIDWAKLRLILWPGESSLGQAIQEVQHLAHLMLSTEDLTFSMIGISLLEKTMEVSPALSGITKEQIQSLRRSYWVTQDFFPIGSSLPLGAKLDSHPGFCLALKSGTLQAIKNKHIFQEEFPFFFSTMNQLIDKHKQCRLKGLRNLWKDSAERQKLACSSELGEKYLGEIVCHPPRLAKISWYRTIIAKDYLTSVVPNYWSIYDQKQSP